MTIINAMVNTAAAPASHFVGANPKRSVTPISGATGFVAPQIGARFGAQHRAGVGGRFDAVTLPGRTSRHHHIESLRRPTQQKMALNAWPNGVDWFPKPESFISEATVLRRQAQALALPEMRLSPAENIKEMSAEQAALLLVALSEQDISQPINARAQDVLRHSRAMYVLPEPTLYHMAKTPDSPFASTARDIRNERLLPLYERWLEADEGINALLKEAILTVAAAYPLHASPTGFEEDKLAILCSFAGGVYPNIKSDIRLAAAEYLIHNVKRIPFVALWGLVVNLSDTKKSVPLESGPKVDDLDALERLLEKGKVPDDIALPWERSVSGSQSDRLAHVTAKELCARLLVERERLPRETSFLFLGQRANTLTAMVLASTVLPIVFPKLTPRQKLGVAGAVMLAGCVHILLVPTLTRLEQLLLAHKAVEGLGKSVGRLRDHLKIKQQNSAERTRNKLFDMDESVKGDVDPDVPN